MEVKNVHITVRLDPDVWWLIKELAAKERITTKEWVKQAMMDKLELKED